MSQQSLRNAQRLESGAREAETSAKMREAVAQKREAEVNLRELETKKREADLHGREEALLRHVVFRGQRRYSWTWKAIRAMGNTRANNRTVFAFVQGVIIS